MTVHAYANHDKNAYSRCVYIFECVRLHRIVDFVNMLRVYKKPSRWPLRKTSFAIENPKLGGVFRELENDLADVNIRFSLKLDIGGGISVSASYRQTYQNSQDQLFT